MSKNNDKHRWLDDPRHVDFIVYALTALCGLLFLVDALYRKHAHFALERWFGFYAVFGFVACVALVLIAKWMRRILMRGEHYYQDDAPLGGPAEAEAEAEADD